MGRNRFASQDTTRIELSDGDWIEVKNELTHGEQARLNARMYGRVDVGGVATGAVVPGIDLEAMAIETLATWLTAWSFQRAVKKTVVRDGQSVTEEVLEPVALTRDAIAALDEATGEEVQGAVARHVQETDRGKATPNGRPRRAARSA